MKAQCPSCESHLVDADPIHIICVWCGYRDLLGGYDEDTGMDEVYDEVWPIWKASKDDPPRYTDFCP